MTALLELIQFFLQLHLLAVVAAGVTVKLELAVDLAAAAGVTQAVDRG
jgi:hypothetical protein